MARRLILLMSKCYTNKTHTHNIEFKKAWLTEYVFGRHLSNGQLEGFISIKQTRYK